MMFRLDDHLEHTVAAGTTAPRLWGLDAMSIHDCVWETHGVAVVRPGAQRVVPRTRAYLLLAPEDLVLFDAAAIARGLPRRHAVTRVRVQERGRDPYVERIVTDDDGARPAIERCYAVPPRTEAVVLVTRDRRLAEQWRAPASQRLVVGAEHVSEGWHFDGDDPAEARRYLATLLEHAGDVGGVVPGVAPVRPGVWGQRDSAIDRNARIIGPVWIGAGVRVAADEIVIGPCVLTDETMPRDASASTAATGTPAAPLRSFYRPVRPDPALAARPLPGKRIFDVVFSLLALLLAAPLFPLIMLAIWLEDGRPFFFAHRRQTIDGRVFKCLKFRTMCNGAEQLRERLAEQNLCDGPQFHIDNDPRLLRIGRLLRKLHLDEVPQFLNVLAGDMHVVGPRPSPHEENQFCPAWREARLSVRPGITGLWQVCRTRAPNVDFQEWIRYDLEYVHRLSWRLDLWIIAQTMLRLLGHTVSWRPAATASPAVDEAAAARVGDRDGDGGLRRAA
ncbi:MAG: sugar transferase [Phycisphaerales bacterium]|nr:sugar transferase [Phycisphaerae bacterium]NNF42458.1 sugar transferase [Phycisphaerales bacterium]NNM27382.1 sugar transferase [Phycisphaerales bacterium]